MVGRLRIRGTLRHCSHHHRDKLIIRKRSSKLGVHLSILVVSLFFLSGFLASSSQASGRLMVVWDEWPLSDTGLSYSSDPNNLILNIAQKFARSSSPRFLVYSDNFGLTSPSLGTLMRNQGYGWQVDTSIPFIADSLSVFDGILLGGYEADTEVLHDYIASGGSVYLAAGTGTSGHFGNNANEAAAWNPFLQQYGFMLESSHNGVTGNVSITSTDPWLVGVDHLYFNYGQDIYDLDPDNSDNRIVASVGSHGLLGVYDSGAPQAGKLFLNHDEWTLSETGFSYASDPDTLFVEAARWLAQSPNPNVLVYSDNFGWTGSSIAEVAMAAGIEFTVSTTVPLTPSELAQYDIICLGGYPADNAVINTYLDSGGSVFLLAGTGTSGHFGNSSAESAAWSDLLAHVGLGLADSSVSTEGSVPIKSEHPVLSGVDRLYFRVGQPILDLDPSDNYGQIIAEYDDNGVVAIFDPGVSGVPDDYDTVMSARLTLEQNYPNPFNPRTTIYYDVPERGHVLLVVYDMKGNRVATLVNGDLLAGEHRAEWNGLTDQGTLVPSGVYFVRLQAAGSERTMKVTLMR